MSLPSNLRLSNNSSLIIPHSEEFSFGDNDFTIEFWIKFNSWSPFQTGPLITKGDTSSSPFSIAAQRGVLNFYTTIIAGTTAQRAQIILPEPSLDTWYHIAVTRSGFVFRAFLNGILVSSHTDLQQLGLRLLNDNISDLTIGRNVDCWIDGLRISRSIARYTSNFVPNPIDPSMVSSFNDKSRFNNDKLVNNGSVIISPVHRLFCGTSAYFDGNSYLNIPGDMAWKLEKDDFTIETWIRPEATSTGLKHIVGTYDGSNGGWSLGIRAPTSAKDFSSIEFRNGDSNVVQRTVSPSIPTEEWSHIAVVRSAGLIKLFHDGKQIGADGPFDININKSNKYGLSVGASALSDGKKGLYFKGYLDDLRITKGIARYKTNFTKPFIPAPILGPEPILPFPPNELAVTERDNIFKVSLTTPTFDGGSPVTSYDFQYSDDGSTWNDATTTPDPHYDKVSLLLPMTGPNNSLNIFDDSKYNHNINIVGAAKTTTEQSRTGDSSVVFDGFVDSVVIQNNAAFDLRNQDWTIEGWIRPTGDWSKHNMIIGKRGNGGTEGTNADWQLYLRQNDGLLWFYSGGDEDQLANTHSSYSSVWSHIVPYVNVWNHVAAVRSEQKITLYLNGIAVFSYISDTFYNTNRKVYIGGWPAGNEYFRGNMNDIRITKGVARYTNNFDPRTLQRAPANRIDGLSTLGTPYTFRAKSVNSVGSSEYSSSTTSIITTLGPPSELHVIPDADRAYLSWKAPIANKSAIKDYSIQYSYDSGNTWTDYIHNPSINTSIVVDGLTTDTSYSFRVAAINIAGIGGYVSTTSPIITTARTDSVYNKTRLILNLDSNQ